MSEYHQLKPCQIIGYQRPPETVIAWRGKKTLTLGDFRRLVLLLIGQINQSASSRWALCFNDSYYFSAALLAVLYCGKTPIIPGHAREAVLKEQRHDYDALLTDLTLLLGCPTVNVTERAWVEQGNTPLPEWPTQDNLILYTSGSTGSPKAMVKSIASLLLENQLLINAFGERLRNSQIVSTVSHQHLYGLTFRILLPLLAGLPFDANLTEYHEQLLCLPPRKKVTLIASPAFLKRLDVKLSQAECGLIFSAGGPLSYECAQRVKSSLSVLPCEIYGTSETGIIATRAQSTPKQIWRPFSGITISQNPDKTINIDSPLFKKDEVGSIDDIIQLEKSGFYLQGRKDRIVKIEEKRISLTEIERRLAQLNEIEDASAVALAHDDRTIIGAVIVLSAYGRQQAQRLGEFEMTRQIRQILRRWLEPVALPKRWRIVEAIPLNNQGKRTHIELQELFI